MARMAVFESALMSTLLMHFLIFGKIFLVSKVKIAHPKSYAIIAVAKKGPDPSFEQTLIPFTKRRFVL